MGKLVRLKSIARPMILGDRRKRIEKETKELKMRHKELYEEAKKIIKNEE